MAFLFKEAADIENAVMGCTDAELCVESELEGKTLPRLVDSGAIDPTMRAAGSRTGWVFTEER